MALLDVGREGEAIATSFLEGKGHRIVDRNYRMKFGEIDIISKRSGRLYFIEVKTVAREDMEKQIGYRVEERVTPFKMKKLARVVEYYLLNKCRERDPEWEFWVVAVVLDTLKKKAFVKVIPETLSR